VLLLLLLLLPAALLVGDCGLDREFWFPIFLAASRGHGLGALDEVRDVDRQMKLSLARPWIACSGPQGLAFAWLHTSPIAPCTSQ
jgi:hypothetical protein